MLRRSIKSYSIATNKGADSWQVQPLQEGRSGPWTLCLKRREMNLVRGQRELTRSPSRLNLFLGKEEQTIKKVVRGEHTLIGRSGPGCGCLRDDGVAGAASLV